MAFTFNINTKRKGIKELTNRILNAFLLYNLQKFELIVFIRIIELAMFLSVHEINHQSNREPQ